MFFECHAHIRKMNIVLWEFSEFENHAVLGSIFSVGAETVKICSCICTGESSFKDTSQKPGTVSWILSRRWEEYACL